MSAPLFPASDFPRKNFPDDPARDGIVSINERIIRCALCPRLVEYRERVAREKKREFRDWKYWGRPIPSFGDESARLLILGLAPAAHGGNRTGRVFTGDASGNWLFRALHKAGFANQPLSSHRGDGLALRDCYITATIHCAPPDNKPLPDEIANCSRYFIEELRALRRVQAVVALGKIAFDHFLKIARQHPGIALPKPLPHFAHGAVYPLRGENAARGERKLTLIASYHPSRQNTNTGKLTEPMFDAVFSRAREILDD